ncbi:MAG: ABC transporter ATP-binding protein [Planctomycetota bacterium]
MLRSSINDPRDYRANGYAIETHSDVSDADMQSPRDAENSSQQVSGNSGETILNVEHLRKSFGGHEALADVSFELRSGERLALLGPNGAGKTTLIRCLCGLTKPSGGRILGFEDSAATDEFRRQLGLVPQEIAVYPDLTTRENLVAFGRMHGVSRRALKEQVQWALHWTGLEDRASDLVGRFSGGMKRRVNIACGVLHRPAILLLDEPTVGVDPQSRHKIFEMLDELHGMGTSIILTTHHLDEAEARSDRIVIMDRGRVIADGPLKDLIESSVGSGRLVKLRLDRPVTGPLHTPLRRLGRVGEAEVSTRVSDVGNSVPRLINAFTDQGYAVEDINIETPSLHHVFLKLTGHDLRDD